MNKEDKYAALIANQIAEMFLPESENFIDHDELVENGTAFIHALANVVPCMFYAQLTGEEKNLLEFNHIANHLVFDFTKSKK